MTNTILTLDAPLITQYDAATLYRMATQAEDYVLRFDGELEGIMWGTVARLKAVQHTDHETGEVTYTMEPDPERTYTVESQLAMLPDGGVVFVPFRCSCDDHCCRFSSVLPDKPNGRPEHTRCKHCGLFSLQITKALVPVDVFDASEAWDCNTKKGRRIKKN